MTKNEILRELREQDELLKKIFDRREKTGRTCRRTLWRDLGKAVF